MSFSDSTKAVGKQPLTVVGVCIDTCTLVAGVGLCTATETGDDKCFNTRNTCNDTANYTRGTVEVKFCQPRSNLPIGENMIPAITGEISKAATSITSGKGLGKRAVVSVKIKDFPHHDRGIDPYIDERSYDPETQGTFWPRWIKRNIYFEGRTLKIYYGYINEPFSWSDFEVQEYDITDISGPTRGQVKITAKDILVRTYSEKAQYPEISVGKLSADITNVATTATLIPAGIGSTYPASGTVAIGKEAINFTRVGDVLTLVRARNGTEAKSHKADDVVQICVVWEDVNVVDVLYELLVTAAGITTDYIPYDDGATGIDENWDDEKGFWLSTAIVNGIIMKPEGIDKLIAEMSEQFMFDIWWDAVDKQIKIKAISPERGGVTLPNLTEGYHIIKDSMKIKRDAKERASEVQVWYEKIDWSEGDKLENFGKASIKVDPSRAGDDKYGSRAVKVIAARWINDLAQASQLSSRIFSRFADTPEEIEFKVSVKDGDTISLAERVDIDSWQFQSFTGANESRRFQVTEIAEDVAGHSLKISALTSSFIGRSAFVAYDGTVDYGSASESVKATSAFIAPDTGVFSDGGEAYQII